MPSRTFCPKKALDPLCHHSMRKQCCKLTQPSSQCYLQCMSRWLSTCWCGLGSDELGTWPACILVSSWGVKDTAPFDINFTTKSQNCFWSGCFLLVWLQKLQNPENMNTMNTYIWSLGWRGMQHLLLHSHARSHPHKHWAVNPKLKEIYMAGSASQLCEQTPGLSLQYLCKSLTTKLM